GYRVTNSFLSTFLIFIILKAALNSSNERFFNETEVHNTKNLEKLRLEAMRLVAGDALGHLRMVDIEKKENRRCFVGGGDRSKAIRAMAWRQRPSENTDTSFHKLVIGREDGCVFTVDLNDEDSSDKIFSLRLPAPIVHISLLHHHSEIEKKMMSDYFDMRSHNLTELAAHSVDLMYQAFMNAWKASSIIDADLPTKKKLRATVETARKSSTGTSSLPEFCTSMNLSSESTSPSFLSPTSIQSIIDSFSYTERLLCLTRAGHACVLPWNEENVTSDGSGSPSPLLSPSNPTLPSELFFKEIYDTQKKKSRAIRRRTSVSTSGDVSLSNISQSTTDVFSQASGSFYRLPQPIDCAATHPLASTYMAFGGIENDLKIMDWEAEKLCWSARAVKRTNLDLRVPVKLTSLCWLSSLNPNVLAVGTKQGIVRIYDLRTQRRPVHEFRLTQENRPITTLSSLSPPNRYHRSLTDTLPHVKKGKLTTKCSSRSKAQKAFSQSSVVSLGEYSVHSKGGCPLYAADSCGMLYKCRVKEISQEESQVQQKISVASSQMANSSSWNGKVPPSILHCSLEGCFHHQMGASTALDVDETVISFMVYPQRHSHGIYVVSAV
ncbi:hypothetical protein IE077_002754, partial [Cardiosporidium cionae]